MARRRQNSGGGCGSLLFMIAFILVAFSLITSPPPSKPSGNFRTTSQSFVSQSTPTREIRFPQEVRAATARPIYTMAPTVTIRPISTQFAVNTSTPRRATQPEVAYTTIRVGSKSEEVLTLKRRLIELGYFRPSSPSREYTESTAKTVAKFQELNGLPATGIANAATLTALYSAAAITADGYFVKSSSVAASASDRVIILRPGASVPSNTSFNPPVLVVPKSTPVPETKQQTITTMVWIPRTGKKYHQSASCSGMKDPNYVSLETAIKRGYGKCSKCW